METVSAPRRPAAPPPPPAGSRRPRLGRPARRLSRPWTRARSRGATTDPPRGRGRRCASAATGSCGCPRRIARSSTRPGAPPRICRSRRSNIRTSLSPPSRRSCARSGTKSSTGGASCSSGASTSRAGRSSARRESIGESARVRPGGVPERDGASPRPRPGHRLRPPQPQRAHLPDRGTPVSTTRTRATSWRSFASAGEAGRAEQHRELGDHLQRDGAPAPRSRGGRSPSRCRSTAAARSRATRRRSS